MSSMKRYDFWSAVVVVLTLILFVIALFIKGLTHEILLEAGVFLVSAKLILMSHKNKAIALETEERLEYIQAMLERSLPARLPGVGD